MFLLKFASPERRVRRFFSTLKTISLWGLCCWVSGLWGCPAQQTRVVSIARQVSMTLIAPSALGRSLSASQVFVSQFRGKKRTMYVQLEVEPSRIAMVGLTPVGMQLFVLTYQREVVKYQPQPFFRAALQPRHVLADFQLVFWPLPAVQTALQPSGLQVRDTVEGGRKRRAFLRGTQVVISIQYEDAKDPWRGKIQFLHRERQYQFSIQTTQVNPLPPPATR